MLRMDSDRDGVVAAASHLRDMTRCTVTYKKPSSQQKGVGASGKRFLAAAPRGYLRGVSRAGARGRLPRAQVVEKFQVGRFFLQGSLRAEVSSLSDDGAGGTC